MKQNSDSLPELHSTVQRIHSTIIHKDDELAIARKNLQESVNEAEKRRCMILFKSGYYMRMGMNDALVDKRISFINESELPVVDSVNDVECFSKVKTEVSRFLLQCIKSIDNLPDFLVKLPTATLQKTSQFLPKAVDPRVFFASSTLPALFGFCHADELTKSYINFLTSIAKKLPESIFDNFRSHWLFDCYKNFIHSSSINRFLTPSLKQIMMDLIDNDSIQELANSNNQTELFNVLIKYAEKMIKNMRDNIALFPPDVSLLISQFADIAKDGHTRTKFVEMMFLDCILAPAISFPTTYFILPTCYGNKLDAAGSCRSLQLLAQVFRLILHPAQAKLRYTDIDHDALTKLPFQELLDSICAIKVDNLQGPKLANILPLIEKKNISLLFSTLDVSMLAFVFKNVTNCPQWVSQIAVSASNIPFKSILPVIYFMYETWDISFYGISSVDIKEVKLQKATETPINLLASTIVAFLSHINIDNESPDDLGSFLDRQEQVALLKEDFVTHTYLNSILQKIIDIDEEDQVKIIPAIKDEIKRHREYLLNITNLITSISIENKEIMKYIEWFDQQEDLLWPILYTNLNDLFITSNPDIVTEFREKRSEMLSNKEVFTKFLFSVEDKISRFFPDMEKFIKEGVAEQFYIWMMQKISLQDFAALHPEFAEMDKQLANVTPQIINSVCIEPSPPKLRDLFQSQPTILMYVKQEFATASSVILPSEAGKHIEAAINLIGTIFKLIFGGIPQADDMTPIINFTLLTSNIPNLHSYSSYIQHFYHEINQKEFKVVSPSTAIAITHFVNHATSFYTIINQ